MKRAKIEETKAIIMTTFALASFALVMWTHDYSYSWLPVVLGAIAAWFWWKVDHFSRKDE